MPSDPFAPFSAADSDRWQRMYLRAIERHACNVVMSGTQDEHRASIDQRTLVQSIRAHREPQQEELMPDAP